MIQMENKNIYRKSLLIFRNKYQGEDVCLVLKKQTHFLTVFRLKHFVLHMIYEYSRVM